MRITNSEKALVEHYVYATATGGRQWRRVRLECAVTTPTHAAAAIRATD